MFLKKSKREEIEERRNNVRDNFTKPEFEIAKIVGKSRATVARDKAYLRKSSLSWSDNLAKGDFILLYQLAVERAMQRIEVLTEMLKKIDDNDKILPILREIREQEKLYLELLSEAPTIHALRRAMGGVDVQPA